MKAHFAMDLIEMVKGYGKLKKWKGYIMGMGLIFLSAHTPPVISFDQLLQAENHSPYHQKLIQIRGFLYQASSGQLILAAQPNLKSCCIGKQSTIHQQIVVKDYVNENPPHQVVMLRGWFKIHPLYNEQGQLIQLFVLEKAELISSSSISFVALFFMGAVLILIPLLLIRKRRQRN